MTAQTAPPVWNDYVTSQDAALWCGQGTPDTDQNFGLIVSMACDWVQSFLGRPIASTQFLYRFDGWSGFRGAYIMLPYYPVISVDSVVEYRGSSGAYTLTESTPSNQTDGYQVEPDTGRLIRVFPGNMQRPWFPGSRNIEVTWTAGFASVPPKIMVATMELVKHWWENSQENTAMSGSQSADYDPASPGPGMFAGVPARITSLLEPLVSVGIG